MRIYFLILLLIISGDASAVSGTSKSVTTVQTSTVEISPAISSGITTDPVLNSKNSSLEICSFNIQFLGSSKVRDNIGLARYIRAQKCDVVVVQELIAPPDLLQLKKISAATRSNGPRYFDGTPYRPVNASSEFFKSMSDSGYTDFWLSEEDTGTSKKNKSNGTNTEWWVVFYKADKVKPAVHLQNLFGFLSPQLAANPHFDRVPYAFTLQTIDEKFDFVLINVHLHPGPRPGDRARRKHELRGIYAWIEEAKKIDSERDFIILGDMNLENKKEMDDVLKETSFVSLNTDAKFNTNTNIKSPKPYDHVFLNPESTTEVAVLDNFVVADLFQQMVPRLNKSFGVMPKITYKHDKFRFLYSDHSLVRFKAVIGQQDDD